MTFHHDVQWTYQYNGAVSPKYVVLADEMSAMHQCCSRSNPNHFPLPAPRFPKVLQVFAFMDNAWEACDEIDTADLLGMDFPRSSFCFNEPCGWKKRHYRIRDVCEDGQPSPAVR